MIERMIYAAACVPLFVEAAIRHRRMPMQTVELTVRRGHPISLKVSALQVTCAQCSCVFSIDVMDEDSARSDVDAYVAHVLDHETRNAADGGIRSADIAHPSVGLGDSGK